MGRFAPLKSGSKERFLKDGRVRLHKEQREKSSKRQERRKWSGQRFLLTAQPKCLWKQKALPKEREQSSSRWANESSPGRGSRRLCLTFALRACKPLCRFQYGTQQVALRARLRANEGFKKRSLRMALTASQRQKSKFKLCK